MIKAVRIKVIFVAIFASILLVTNCLAGDLLDSVRSNSTLVNDLKDVYRAYKINHAITVQQELINLFLSDQSRKELGERLAEYIKECEKLKEIPFTNDTLNYYVQNYLELTIMSYQVARDKGFGSATYKKDFANYKAEKKKYINYLAETYSTGRFVGLSEEKYWKVIDKKNYINSGEYKTYENTNKSDLKKSLALLEDISKRTNDFQEQAIYQIEIADQYVRHAKELIDISNSIPINKYKSIIDQKKYCLYLFEAWLKWRTVYQQNNGLSKFSEIPNDEYDKEREKVALVILYQVTKNDKDEMAINEFLLMATHDIVRRFGDYQYGNQNTVEYHEIFDDKN
jgi:hypothetical protein